MAKNYKRIFADNLRKFRKEINLTQEALAEKAELSATIISDYENERKEPGITSAQKLADVLGVTLNELVDNTPETQFKKRLDSEGILTVLSALELLKAKVIVEDHAVKLILDFKNDCSDYSFSNILSFFKEYERIQKLADSSVPEGTAEKCIDSLKEKYKNLPALPEYKG